MNMRGLLANFDDTLREYEQDRRKTNEPKPVDEKAAGPKPTEVNDELDDLIRTRQDTRRSSTKNTMLSSMVLNSLKEINVDEGVPEEDSFEEKKVEEGPREGEEKDKMEEEITEEQIEDDFADFDYVAPTPPTPAKFPVETPPGVSAPETPGELPELVKKPVPNKKESRRSSYLDSLTSKNQDSSNRQTDEMSRISDAGRVRASESFSITQPPNFDEWVRPPETRQSEPFLIDGDLNDDFNLPAEGRGRTMNTVSINILSGGGGSLGIIPHEKPVEHEEIPEVTSFNRAAASILKTSLKGPRRSMVDSRAIVAEIYSDITESEENDESSPDKNSDLINSLASPLVRRQKVKVKAKFGSSTKNLRKNIKEDSKLGSLFLSQPIKEFTQFDSEYKKEMIIVKEARGGLTLDVDLIKEFSEHGCNSEIRIRDLRGNFFNFIEMNYGKLTCIAAEPNIEFVIAGTERGLLVLWDKSLQDKYQVVQLSTTKGDYPSAMFYDPAIDAVCVGMTKGDMHFYKLEKAERHLKKRNVCKGFSPNEILIVRAFKQLSHVLAVDAQYRILYCRIDRTKEFQKTKLTSYQVGITKRNTIPHLSAMPLSATSALVAVSAATEIQIFEIKDHVNLRDGESYIRRLAVFSLEIPKWLKETEQTILTEANTEDTGDRRASTLSVDENVTKPGSSKETVEEQFSRATISGSLSAEDMDSGLNHSFVVFTGLKEEVDKPFVLCVAHQKTIFIYELVFSDNEPLVVKLLTEIRIQARALQFTSFVGGLMLLFDIYGDFYVVDEINSIQSAINSSPHRKSRINSRNKKLREYIARANACYKEGVVGDSSPSGDDVKYDEENVFLVYDHSQDHLTYYKTLESGLTNYTNMVQALGNLGMVFVDKKGLYVFEIMDWKAYLEDCFECQNFYMVLRVINEIIDGENDRLRRAPPRGKREEQLSPYLQRVMHNVVPYIKIEPESDIERLTSYCVMTLYKCGLTEFILKDYDAIMQENGLYNYYVSDMVLMYQSQLLPHSNIDRIFSLLNFLEKHDPMENKRFMLYLFSKKLYQDQLMNMMTKANYMNLLFYTSDKVDLPSKAMFSLEYLKQNITSEHRTKEEKRHDIYRIFWFVCEHVVAKLEKNEVQYQDPAWYITNWLLKPENITPLLKIDLQAYLQGWGMLLNLGISSSLNESHHLYLMEGVDLIKNEIMDQEKSSAEMVYLFNFIYNQLKTDDTKRNLFYLYLAVLKFVKTPGVELNDEQLKELVFGLIKNINEIVAGFTKMGIDLTHENVNILIFATFTEHKEIFVDNQELKELIYKNE